MILPVFLFSGKEKDLFKTNKKREERNNNLYYAIPIPLFVLSNQYENNASVPAQSHPLPNTQGHLNHSISLVVFCVNCHQIKPLFSLGLAVLHPQTRGQKTRKSPQTFFVLPRGPWYYADYF